MPESPETKGQSHTPITSPNPMAGGVNSGVRDPSRPPSNNNVGEHSPVNPGMVNGRIPTSPSGPMPSSQQLPPACGARQLSKLKRFLTTLQQFGSDISPEIGERVRSLVLGLVNSHLSIEEFHSKLQEATNFPLRPFVIPFLKANLPLLQRELMHLARMAKETPQSYLSQNEHILFNATQSPLEAQDNPNTQINENGKRLSPESRGHENGIDAHPAKRHRPTSPHGPNRISPNGILNLSNGPIRLEDISISRELREREKLERERLEKERVEHRDRDFDRERYIPSHNFGRSESAFDTLERFDDDWRHVETMLNCIIGMVDKTRRALSVLQDRSIRDREELSMWMRRSSGADDADLKKRNPEAWQNMRSAEERISDVRRRAEEAVQEVKRQAMLELHKAMAAADTKANELVSQERTKMERAMEDIRKQTREEVLSMINHQEESSESCWNCGRKASETCSGCNTARYCGSFCQHKDWENHHHVCGKASLSRLTSQVRDPAPQAASTSPPAANSPRSRTTPSPTNSVSSVKSVSRSSTPAEVKQAETRAAEVTR